MSYEYCQAYLPHLYYTLNPECSPSLSGAEVEAEGAGSQQREAAGEAGAEYGAAPAQVILGGSESVIAKAPFPVPGEKE